MEKDHNAGRQARLDQGQLRRPALATRSEPSGEALTHRVQGLCTLATGSRGGNCTAL